MIERGSEAFLRKRGMVMEVVFFFVGIGLFLILKYVISGFYIVN